MIETTPATRRLGMSIGSHLLPQLPREQNYWNEHLRQIQLLPHLEAKLHKCLRYCERTNKQNEAIALLHEIGVAWAVIRQLSSTSKSKAEKTLSDYELLAQLKDPVGVPGAAVRNSQIDNIAWAYSLNSSLRHPFGSNEIDITMMYQDPWPPVMAERLLQAGQMVLSALRFVRSKLSPGSGFAPDIAEKLKFITAAQATRD
jgi:hypothetical protein